MLLGIMDVLRLGETKLAKRIKLEHSYAYEVTQFEFAEVREEDPLKIYPEDLHGIKKETEDEETIIIKTEPASEDGDNNSLCDSLQSTNEYSDYNSHKESISKENSVSYSGHLEPISGYEVEIGSTDHIPNVNSYEDTVPRHVFLELQTMYERTMTDLKVLSDKMGKEENTVTTQKSGSRARKNEKNSKPQAQKNEIKKLKEEVQASRAREHVLMKELDIRVREEMELKRTTENLEKQQNEFGKCIKELGVQIGQLRHQLTTRDGTIKNLKLTLRQQIKSSAEKKLLYANNLHDLKQQLTAKDALNKHCELKCTLLAQKLVTMNTKFIAQKTELAKLKLDMDIMDKSIIDSLKTRQTLKEHLVKLERELHEIKTNPTLTLKFQEAQKGLNMANRRIEELQKLLVAEKKMSSHVSKERDQLVEEQDGKFREYEKQLVTMKQSISVLKSSLCQKLEQSKLFRDEIAKLQEDIKLKEEEIQTKGKEIKKKEEEYKTKQCEYCGF